MENNVTGLGTFLLFLDDLVLFASLGWDLQWAPEQFEADSLGLESASFKSEATVLTVTRKR